MRFRVRINRLELSRMADGTAGVIVTLSATDGTGDATVKVPIAQLNGHTVGAVLSMDINAREE